MARRIVQLAATAAFSAVAVAGCGVSSGSGTDIAGLASPEGLGAAFLSDAATQTAGATRQRVSIQVEVVDGDGETVVSTSGEGAFDEEAQTGQLKVDSSTAGPLEDVDLGIEVVYDGEDAYVRSGLFEVFTGGKPWVSVQGDAIEDLEGELGSSVPTDPTGFVELLESAAGPLEDLGTESVRDVPTRHVAGELDAARLVDEVAPEQAERFQELLDQVPGVADDVSAIPVEAWIDADGYVRRFTMTISHDAGADDPAAGASVRQTIELWDFDEPLDITVPPADEVHVIDPSDLFGN